MWWHGGLLYMWWHGGLLSCTNCPSPSVTGRDGAEWQMT